MVLPIGSQTAIENQKETVGMTITHRFSTGVVVALALAAASAPGASARPADDPATAVNGAPTAVYSRPDKSMIPASPPATSGAAVGRAALPQSLAQQQRQRDAALSAYREGQLAIGFDVAGTANKTSAPQAIDRVDTPPSRFDWGDAGIGAAGGLALAMIGLGGALAVSQNRARRTRGTTGLPS
jgi:hypothetical protein